MHPNSDILMQEGYVLLQFNPPPMAKEGYSYREFWTDEGVQQWIEEKDISEDKQHELLQTAQIEALTARNEFLEDCIAEMAAIVYA